MAIHQLIQELQNSEGPDRDLDTTIAFVARYKRSGSKAEVPRYTSSIDAAMDLAKSIAPTSVGAAGWLSDGSGTAVLDSDEATFGANPAIAMCISALKRKESADRINAKILKRSSSSFHTLFKEYHNSKTLLVVLSEFQGFMMTNREFHAHTLHVYEVSNSYYTFQIDLLAQDILDFSQSIGVNNVIFTGSSKSGYGAIVSGRLFAGDRLNISSRVVAFSPVTRVYPLDKPLPFKTYPIFLNLVKDKDEIRDSAERLGTLPKSPISKNYKEKIIYGKHNDYDRGEIQHLIDWSSGCETYLSISYIPASTHNVISLLAADKSSSEEFVSSVEKEPELPWLRQDSERLKQEVSEILEMIKNVTIEDVLGIEFESKSPESEMQLNRKPFFKSFFWRKIRPRHA